MPIGVTANWNSELKGQPYSLVYDIFALNEQYKGMQELSSTKLKSSPQQALKSFVAFKKRLERQASLG